MTTLHEVFSSNEEIYVSFPGIKGQPPGVFVLNHPNKDLKIPPLPIGHDPINLTALLDNRQLRDCQDLRVAIGRGILKLWEPEEARSHLAKHPERVDAVKNKIAELSLRARTADPRLKVKYESGSLEDFVNPRVLHVVEELHDRRLTAEAALNMLLPMESGFTDSDLEYLHSAARNFEVCEWAQEVLNTRSGEAPPPLQTKPRIVRPDEAEEPVRRPRKRSVEEDEISVSAVPGSAGFESALERAKEKAMRRHMEDGE